MTQTVFFDLDGTLTDPKVGITTCIQYALQKLKFEVIPKDDLTWCIGPPLQESFVVLVGHQRSAEALALYRERFSEIGWKENSVYPGIEDTLERLRAAEFRLFVATSKPHVYANQIVGHFQLDQYFDTVYGAELDGTRCDKSELLQYALCDSSTTGVASMVGDRKHDVIGALANSMTAIGVTYGYGSRQELHEAGASRIVDRPGDLLATFSLK